MAAKERELSQLTTELARLEKKHSLEANQLQRQLKGQFLFRFKFLLTNTIIFVYSAISIGKIIRLFLNLRKSVI